MNIKIKRKKGFIVGIVLVLLFVSFPMKRIIGQNNNTNKRSGHVLEKTEEIDQVLNYSISTGNKDSTLIGQRVLQNGGNAIDAAIAISFGLGVVAPQNGGLGGGGVVLVYDPIQNKSFYYDYYNSTGHETSNYQIGIPGFLRGMEAIYTDYASMPIEMLLSDSISLAREGITVSEDLGNIIERRSFITEFNKNFINNGKIITANDILIQEDLAQSYEQVVKSGFGIIYDGESEMSQNLMRETGLTAQSLQDYSVRKYEALAMDLGGRKVYGAGTPFSSITSMQMLSMYDKTNFNWNEFESDESLLVYNELYSIASTENYIHVGDNETYRSNLYKHANSKYVDKMLSEKNIESSTDINESQNTTSFTVIDDQGFVVVGTHTLSNYWGSGRSHDGFFYNNSLKHFSNSTPNVYGTMKRPKTFMSPLIIKDDEETIAIGAAGGYAIPQVVPTIISMYLDSGIPLETAVDTQRFGKYNKVYMIERSKLRGNKLFEHEPTIVSTEYVDIDQKVGFISLSSVKNNNYNAYYETTWCDASCAVYK
ncbi:MAG: gamma-glutamyltransferase [Erysipelothrix sp.]